MVRVTAGARLHFGFGNLSLSHERLYGALGVALAEPRVVVDAKRVDDNAVGDDGPAVRDDGPKVGDDDLADRDDGPTVRLTLECAYEGFSNNTPAARDALTDDLRTITERACDLLEVPGAAVTLRETLPRHAGLGSGTQLALATLTAIARAYDKAPAVRSRAPALGRGGRSGIGVACFERGGFVLDAGHPTARFTTDRPSIGNWEVPAVAARHPIPDDWRFLLVSPETEPGRSGESEDESMRAVVERAEPAIGDRIAGIVVRRVLPAIAEGRTEAFGEAVAEIGRLNGAWYADEQGGVYRPPVGDVVAGLDGSTAVFGAGQSSWGPVVFGVTDADHVAAAVAAGEDALDAAGVSGDVRVVRGRNRGTTIAEE